MAREYDAERWNCAHFAAEVWRRETGEDILSLLVPAMQPGGRVPLELARQFARCAPRHSPCLVVMRRGHDRPHLGVLVRGRVAHLGRNGVVALPPDCAAPGRVLTYYRRRPCPAS